MLTVERSKRRIEVITVAADFSDRMDAADSIVSAVASIELFSGDDSNPSDMLYLPINIYTQSVAQRVRLGVVGAIYILQISATTSTGAILRQSTPIAILENAKDAIPSFIPAYFTSHPYPVFLENSLQVGSIPINGELRATRIFYTNTDDMSVSANPLSGELRALLLSYAEVSSNIQVGASPSSGELRQVFIGYSVSNDTQVSAAPRDGTLKQILITYNVSESASVSAAPLTGSLS